MVRRLPRGRRARRGHRRGGGRDLYAAPLPRPLAVAIGNEGAGLSPALRAQADLPVTIPMPGGMESLNAAAAAAVVLFEALRGARQLEM